jgi:PKD repeat protein
VTAEVIVSNADPAAEAVATPSPQYWGLPVRFVGSATDPSTADTAAGLNPAWSFGDGTANPTRAAVEHSYTQPGTHTATFAATDKDGGTGSASTRVEVKKRESTLTYTGAQTIDANGNATLSARFSDPVDNATADLAGHDVVFAIDGKAFTATTDAAGVALVSGHPAVDPGTVTVSFDGDARYLRAETSRRIDYELVFGNGNGFFTIGTSTAAVGRTATFWSNSWAALNHVVAPSSFKGFVSTPITPTCQARWTSRPGNSGDPPPTVPHYLAVVVTREATQSGSVISNDVAHIAIIKTLPGYGPSPGHDGTGSVVEMVC